MKNKAKSIALIALLSVNLFCYSQEKIVELPLTTHNGYGPFRMTRTGVSMISQNAKHLKPEYLTDVIMYGYIETNEYQAIYQKYILGKITKEQYEGEQKRLKWIPDTLNLSKTPIRTEIVFVFGQDSDKNYRIAVDANNNLEFSDDELFPLEANSYINSDISKRDSLVEACAIHVSFETYVHQQIVPVSVPLYICYEIDNNAVTWTYSFQQYSTTQFKGEQIAVCSNFFPIIFIT